MIKCRKNVLLNYAFSHFPKEELVVQYSKPLCVCITGNKQTDSNVPHLSIIIIQFQSRHQSDHDNVGAEEPTPLILMENSSLKTVKDIIVLPIC